MMVFSLWSSEPDGYPHTCVGGRDRPVYGPGDPMEDCVFCVEVFDAASPEDAFAYAHMRMSEWVDRYPERCQNG